MIIDNLSKISIELSKNNNAQLFMDELFKLVKGDEKYTIIIIAHTVKVKAYESLDENHLKGASDINQLLDNLILKTDT